MALTKIYLDKRVALLVLRGISVPLGPLIRFLASRGSTRSLGVLSVLSVILGTSNSKWLLISAMLVPLAFSVLICIRTPSRVSLEHSKT